MGIEDKIILPIFEGIQKNHTIYDINSIKNLFKEKLNINKSLFDKFWNSLTIELLIKKQEKNIKKSHLNEIPTMIINGKYNINYSNIEKIFKENFNQKYIELIKFLNKKK